MTLIRGLTGNKYKCTIDQELTYAAVYVCGRHFIFTQWVEAQHFPARLLF